MQGDGAGPPVSDGGIDKPSLWGDEPGDLYRAHVQDVLRYLVSKVGQDLGEELTAQTFVEAWSEQASYDADRGTPQAWIFGIAGNVLRHHFRQERRRSAAHLALSAQRRLAGFADAVEDEVVDAVVATERMSQVDMALSGAERVDREVLELAVQPGATYQAMADHLGVPIGTVRSRLSRARQRLAAQVDSGPN